MKRILLLLGGMFFFAAVLWVVWPVKKQEPSSLPLFPQDVELRTSQGKKSGVELRAAPLVVMLWTTWCPRCAEELRSLAEFKKTVAGSLGLVFINRGENTDVALHYLSLVPGFATSTPVLFDQTDVLYKKINGFSMPEILFIDRDGRIRYQKHGFMEYEEIRRRAEDVIANNK